MSNLIILVPPSEGKQSGGAGQPLKRVGSTVKAMMDALDQVKDKDWPKILGVKGKALEQAVNANQSVLQSPTMPAIERYTGVVYNAINYASMKPKAQQFFDEHVRIVSALFGLVTSQQMIPDYKLKIDKLGADKYWKPIHAETLKSDFVLDLLPQAHKKAVAYEDGQAVDFIIMKDGKKKPAGHYGKHIKGQFIRWICENQATSSSTWKKFAEDGFVWDNGFFIKEEF